MNGLQLQQDRAKVKRNVIISRLYTGLQASREEANSYTYIHVYTLCINVYMHTYVCTCVCVCHVGRLMHSRRVEMQWPVGRSASVEFHVLCVLFKSVVGVVVVCAIDIHV